ncbi:hypothetical protein TNCV_2304811 [Trichonephila clavipes]|nr:hypothetical protein TNCV_2304811 [Trichonephila clavipes]
MVLKATANDMHLASCYDEFRGPGSDTVEIRREQMLMINSSRDSTGSAIDTSHAFMELDSLYSIRPQSTRRSQSGSSIQLDNFVLLIFL